MLVCSECGSKNIETKAWVDANTKEFIGNDGEDTWCNGCEENDISFIAEEEFQEQEKDGND